MRSALWNDLLQLVEHDVRNESLDGQLEEIGDDRDEQMIAHALDGITHQAGLPRRKAIPNQIEFGDEFGFRLLVGRRNRRHHAIVWRHAGEDDVRLDLLQRHGSPLFRAGGRPGS